LCHNDTFRIFIKVNQTDLAKRINSYQKIVSMIEYTKLVNNKEKTKLIKANRA